MKIAILFVGALEDGGFNQSALAGARRMQAEANAEIEIVDGIPYDSAAMQRALQSAASRSDGLIFVGGQGNGVTPPVAEAHPDLAFAIVQGNVTADNLASYDILQEQSAFLAGVLAARMTRSGTVGHLSGHRVVPGLKGRAAFAAGVRHVNSAIPIVTGFCGTQDDSRVTETWARAIGAQGADILFTMLNAARDGASEACRATGMRQIGNVTDWCQIDPQVYVASAVARIDMGVERAVRDMLAGQRPRKVQPLGLTQHAAHLACAPDVPAPVRDEIAETAKHIASGQLTVDTAYDGPEFEATA